jgi:hypothetical protein
MLISRCRNIGMFKAIKQADNYKNNNLKRIKVK